MSGNKQLSHQRVTELMQILEKRFSDNMHRHKNSSWDSIRKQLDSQPQKLWTLSEMEITGGEPDVVSIESIPDSIVFIDCSSESPKGRRSICYDKQALESRKENKPSNSAHGMAEEMGIEILSEPQYRELQQFGKFDSKTSSWVETPYPIRKLGGALFGDFRYGSVFIYHNGAESYYAARGFRGMLKL